MRMKLAWIICILGLFTVSCSSVGQPVSLEPDQPPVMVVLKGDKEYSTTLGGYTWTANGGVKAAEETWPPPLPGIPVPAEQEDKVTLLLKGPYKKPDRAEMKLYFEGAFRYESREEKKELASLTLERADFREGEEGITAVFTFPTLNKREQGRKFVMEMEFLWLEGEGVKNRVVYYAMFQETNQKVVQEIESTITGFVEAVWEGSREEACLYLSDRALHQVNNPIDFYYSFTYLDERAGWDLLLWQDPKREFRRTGQPTLDIISVWSSLGFLRAEAIFRYEMEVVEEKKSQPWKFEEYYNLERQEGQWKSEWKINAVKRNGRPVDIQTGKTGWNISAEKEGGLLRIGPFTRVSFYKGLWSPNGDRVAFVGENFKAQELWEGQVSTGQFGRVFRVEAPEVPGSDMHSVLTVLGVKDDGRVTFMIRGYMSSGPYQGQQGFWILEKPAGDGDPRTLAFVPEGRADYIHSLKLVGGGEYLLIQNFGKLFRINLADGSHKVLREDMPDYLVRVLYNEEGTLMAWEKRNGQEIKVLVYDPVNEKEVILRSPEEGLRIDLQGLFGDLIAVSLCRPELVQQGEDGDWPVGIEKILLYSFDGNVQGKIVPPEGQYISLAGYDDRDGSFYYATGGVDRENDPAFGEYMYLRGLNLYRWSRDKSSDELIADIDGRVTRFEPVPDGKLIWYSSKDDGESYVQKGLLYENGGNIKRIERNFDASSGKGQYLLQAWGREYVNILDRDNRISYLIEIREDGKEVLLSGPFYINQWSAAGNNVLFVADPGNIQPEPHKAYIYIMSN